MASLDIIAQFNLQITSNCIVFEIFHMSVYQSFKLLKYLTRITNIETDFECE